MEPNLRPGEDLQHYVDRQAVEMAGQATALGEAIAASAATVTSRDGAVTVSLMPNGALRDLKLGKRACELGEARLTAAILDTVRQAQGQTARAVTSSVQSIIGDGDAVEMMKSFLPPEPAVDGDAIQNKFAAEPEPDIAPPPPKPPVAPPQPPRRAPRRRPAEDDGDDEMRPW